MAVKNIIDLNNQADSLLPDNNQQLISPADVRTTIKDINDSAINRVNDRIYLNLRAYSSSRTYDTGEGCFYGNIIYEALQETSGPFNPLHWTARSSPNGTWGSILGDINNQSDLLELLDAKQDSIGANNPLFISGTVLNINQASNLQNGYLSSTDWSSFNNKENTLTFETPLVRDANNISIQYASETQDGIISSANWIDLNSLSITEISYPDALTAIDNAELKPGKFYKILKGTRLNESFGTNGDIIIQAISQSQFSYIAFLTTRLPAYEQLSTNIVTIWDATVTPQIDDLYITEGSVYKNLTGTTTITNPSLDNLNWELVPYSDTSVYKQETDLIGYDILLDWISYRADNRGNRVFFSRSISSGTYNAIDRFQWGYDVNFGNTIDNGFIDNLNSTTETKLINLTKGAFYKSLATTTNRTYTFQDADGTVAFLSDLGGGVELVSITYDDLRALYTNETLVPGTYYRITDFQTIHLIPETNVINTGETEPLICLATSSNTIDSNVYSTIYPYDTIQYDITNNEVEDLLTARKGKITYRKDNIRNLETWYDFRAVKFRRWQIDGSNMIVWAFSTSYTKGQVVYYSGTVYKALTSHVSGTNFINDLTAFKWAPVIPASTNHVLWKTSVSDFGSTLGANGTLFQDLLTFHDDCKNISIGNITSQPYNNIVFPSGVQEYTFGFSCSNMTIFGNASFNTIGDRCTGIILYNGANYNTIEDDGFGIILSNGSSNNIIGQRGVNIFIAGSCNKNSFEPGCQNNFINSGCEGNIFKKDAKYNYLESGAAENVIGVRSEGNVITASARGNQIGGLSNNLNGANNNIFNSSTYNNVIAEGCSGNTFTNGANNNKVQENSSNNLFTNGSNNNLLSIGCNSNTFTNSSSFNTIGSGSGNNSFNIASNNSIGQSSYYNTFNQNAHGNSIGNRSDFNAFGNNSVGNRIGNYCVSNQVLPSIGYYYGVSGQYNVFENYCSNNVINGNYNRLDSYCHFIQCTTQVYLSNCFFCSGTQNISLSGLFIIDNLRILLSRGFSSIINISSANASKYNNIVVDMKDTAGTLWYKTISLSGKISTKKFI